MTVRIDHDSDVHFVVGVEAFDGFKIGHADKAPSSTVRLTAPAWAHDGRQRARFR